jgi:hypothetical protein
MYGGSTWTGLEQVLHFRHVAPSMEFLRMNIRPISCRHEPQRIVIHPPRRSR